MADMKFFMGNAILIIGLALAFANYGLADALNEDLDISSGGEDFDIDRLSFQNQEDFQIDTGTQNTLKYDGTENDRNESYGYVQYNLTGVETFSLDVQTSRFAFLSGISVYINGVELSGSVDKPTNGRTVYDVSDKMDQYSISGEPDTMEVRIYNTDDRIIDAGGGLDFEDFLDSSSINEETFDVELGAFDQLASALSTSVSAISQLPQMIGAWVQFVSVIPGVIGTAFRMYLAAFFVYFLVVYVWIG